MPVSDEQLRLAQISQLTREIKRLYADAKTKRMRVAYKPRSRDQGAGRFFEAAAQQAYSLGLSAQQYIDACFSECQMKEGPFVNALGGAAAAKWCAAWQSNRSITRSAAAAANPIEPKVPKFGDDAHAAGVREWLAQFEADLRQAIYSVAVCRNVPPGVPGFIEAVVDTHVVMAVLCRLYFAGAHPDIKLFFKDELIRAILDDPFTIPALKQINYPIEDAYRWLAS